MGTVAISLTFPEFEMVDELARRRVQDAIRQGSEFRYGQRPPGHQLDLVGMMGELAACRFLGCSWTGIRQRNGGDVTDAFPIEVRTRIKKPDTDADLCLIKADKPNIQRPFILAHVELDSWNIPWRKVWLMGWVWGHEGMRRRYWSDRFKRYGEDGACFVPVADLHPMSELTKELDRCKTWLSPSSTSSASPETTGA